MDSKKRLEIRTELAAQGFAWSYVDSWPPKTSLYVHKPMLNPEGAVVNDRGVLLPNMPGHPDFVARKSRIGLLPWPPGETCKCKACREHDWHPVLVQVAVAEESIPDGLKGLWPGDMPHPHQFGRAVGSACKVQGCEAVRVRPFTARTKRAA